MNINNNNKIYYTPENKISFKAIRLNEKELLESQKLLHKYIKAPESGLDSLKNEDKVNSKTLKIIIPIIAVLLVAIIIAVVLVSGKDRMDPIVVTDDNGVPVTDVNGDVITVTPETAIYYVTDVFGNIVTDSDGNPLTTVEFKDVAVQIPVTDMNGVVVTDAKGNAVTQNITLFSGTRVCITAFPLNLIHI